MNNRQYERALRALERGFTKKFPTVKPKALNKNKVGKLTPRQMAAHFKAMLPQMHEFLDANRFDKLNRFLFNF